MHNAPCSASWGCQGSHADALQAGAAAGLQGPPAAAATAAARPLGSSPPPVLFGLRIPLSRLRPPSLLSSASSRPPFIGQNSKCRAVRGSPASSSERRQREAAEGRTAGGSGEGTRLSSSPRPATLIPPPPGKARTRRAPRAPSLTPPPAGCWDGERAVGAGARRLLGAPGAK